MRPNIFFEEKLQQQHNVENDCHLTLHEDYWERFMKRFPDGAKTCAGVYDQLNSTDVIGYDAAMAIMRGIVSAMNDTPDGVDDPAHDGELVQSRINALDFSGVSGRFSFTKDGFRKQRYRIVNLQPNGYNSWGWKTVGSFNPFSSEDEEEAESSGGLLSIDYAAIKFFGGGLSYKVPWSNAKQNLWVPQLAGSSGLAAPLDYTQDCPRGWRFDTTGTPRRCKECIQADVMCLSGVQVL